MSVSEITIRPAQPSDADELVRLAELDSQRPPTGDVLLGEVCGRLVAAIEAATDRTLADPFRPTADVIDLLRLRSSGNARTPRRALPALPRLA